MARELLEMRLKRYLHYGNEQPIYKCGDRFHHKCYSKENVPSLLQLIEQDNPETIIDIILKIVKEETSLWPDAITYVLAVCAQQDNSLALQNAAYQSLRTVCKTSRDILLFVKFYMELKGKISGGNGFKRAIAQWYLVWMPFDLAEIFLQQNKYFGWSHKDVLRIAHVKPLSIEQEVLFTYMSKGLGEAVKKHAESSNEQVIELLQYITTVESFKKTKEPETVAKALSVELHNIDRVPTGMLKHQIVWNELIPNLDVVTLLDNLQRISILGFLKNNNMTVMKVKDVLNNLHKAKNFKCHPTRVFIEYMTYEKAASYCLDMAKTMNCTSLASTKKPPKRNTLIKNALMDFYYSLFKFQKPTDVNYLVAVDVSSKMFTDRCLHSMHLSPIEAATAVCASLMRVEAQGKVNVGVFVNQTKENFQLIDCVKDWETSKYESTFKQLSNESNNTASISSIFNFAQENKMHVDVFLVLSNYRVCTKYCRHNFVQYRDVMQLPNSKLITCSLSGNIQNHKKVERENMQCVIGFDEHICRLIEAIARGAF